MKRILSVFTTMPVGGAEMFWLNILEELDRDRFEAVTCCIADKGTVGRMIEDNGHEVISLGRMKSKSFDTGVIRDLRRIMRERNIDILHTHLYHASLYGRLAALSLGRQRPGCVVQVANVYTRLKFHRTMFNRFLMRYTDRVVAVSEPVKRDVMKHDRADGSMVEVVNSCIDHRKFDIPLSKEEAKSKIGLGPDDFVLGNVARLVEAKGQSYLLEALALLHKAGHGFRLVIVGNGKLMEPLRSQAKSLGLDGHVLFLGERHDLPELFRAMDVYVMPSLWEGAPLALASAMAAGLPSVVTTAGGMPEMVGDGTCGVVVRPKDPQALADAVLELSGSAERMAGLSGNARDRGWELYSCEKVARQLEDLYEGLF